MGLGESTIRTWDDMKTSFLQNYLEYSKPKDSQHDIFKIQQLKDEILEDFLERSFIHYISLNIMTSEKM